MRWVSGIVSIPRSDGCGFYYCTGTPQSTAIPNNPQYQERDMGNRRAISTVHFLPQTRRENPMSRSN
jgi:hypothetical protein